MSFRTKLITSGALGLFLGVTGPLSDFIVMRRHQLITSEGSENHSMSLCINSIISGAIGLFVGVIRALLELLIMWMFPSTKKYLL